MPRRPGATRRSTTRNLFDMEYWSLEQAKLGAAAEKPLAGQIVAVTGAGGTIGAATAKAFAAAGAEVALLDVNEDGREGKGQGDRRRRDRHRLRCHRRGLGKRGVRPGRRGLRRRRHRGVERGRGVAGPHRRGRRSGAARKLRAEFLRPPARRAGRDEDHAGARHRRLPAVQRLEAGGEPGPELRPLWPAQGRDACCSCANTRSTTAPTASAPTR